MTCLVSILIPAYNAEKWIDDSIASALSQTWKRKEVIIVNDGSKDRTLEIARRYESKYVKVVTQRNKGTSAARNKALSLSQGDYIQWLDADDLLAPDKISQQLERIHKKQNPRILLSSAWGKMFFRLKKAKMEPNLLWQDLAPVEWIITVFSENVWMANLSFLVSRELTEMTGPWDERLSLNDDGEYFCRVVCNSDKVLFVPDAISYYRQCNIKSLARSRTNAACQSLFLSHKQSIGHLLSLENTARTKAASVKLLKRWLYHFYPEKPYIYPKKNDLLREILIQLNDLSDELGGEVLPPDLNWKYNFIKKIFGWKMALIIADVVYNTKLFTIISVDRFLHNLSVK